MRRSFTPRGLIPRKRGGRKDEKRLLSEVEFSERESKGHVILMSKTVS